MMSSQSLRTTRNQRRTIPVRRLSSLLSRPTHTDASSARRISVFAAAALLCWTGTLGAAVAQASDGSGDTQRVQPCVAKPEDQAKGNDGNDALGGNDKAENRPQPSPGECGGVLVPPKTGDQEMRIEPPDKGTTPVIPPGAIPEQPSK